VSQTDGASAVDVASMPWVFTQRHPLDTSTFASEAGKRGIELDLATLRELYRHRLLVPFVELTHRPTRAPFTPDEPEPIAGSSRLTEIRQARNTGCLRDLSAMPFLPRLPFECGRQKSRFWWNGLIYSQYQLLALPVLEDRLRRRTYHKRGTHRVARLPAPHPLLLDQIGQMRKMTVALTALEARYLPKLDAEWIQLNNADVEGWEGYRDRFDPVQMREWLHYPAEQIRQDAEGLLLRAGRLDPVGAAWSQLMRRAPAKARERLKDAALQALDLRIAAEILLLFYEDLGDRNQAEPLPDVARSMAWHPLHERLSYRPKTLDENLVALGISPHPRVVLALEGETEMYHAPFVWRALGFSDAPELMRLLKLGAANRDLVKLAALAAAPLVSEKVPGTDAWTLIKPYARLLVAVDPDPPFTTAERVARERAKILDEIKDVLKTQGVERPDPAELDHLVEIRTWDAPCYEFAHFTEQELADGIITVHETINGLIRDELIASLARTRGRGKDVKEVWGQWVYKVSKVELAKALLPVLLGKVRACMTAQDAPVPPIAQVVSDAYHLAQQWRYQSYALTELPGQANAPEAGSGSS
jgi:hypothetical protein